MSPSKIAQLRTHLEKNQKKFGYPIPKSLEEAENQREVFVEQYEQICETLRTSKTTRHGPGHVVWENQTKQESERLQRRIKWLNRWIRLRKIDMANLTLVTQPNDPVQLLYASHTLLQRLVAGGLVLSNDDRAIFELIQSFCTR
jgi:hypothetical protein